MILTFEQLIKILGKNTNEITKNERRNLDATYNYLKKKLINKQDKIKI